ncbi:MAG: sigma 54-interacting transcriptional regulator [Acidobacteriaceae bacterium]|nr:sigma 54-interacting transcriptional regulator [Acidobacteriaceae bacterium]
MLASSPGHEIARDPKPFTEKMMESLPDAILVVGGDGRILEANQQAERMFGHSRAGLAGQRIELLIPERFRGAHILHRNQYQTESRLRPMGAGLELYGLRKDGTEFPVDIMLSPVQTEEGNLVLAVVRDITLRKEMEEALRLSEERLRLIVENARDYAIFMLDPAGNVSTWNTGAERLKGYRAEEIIGRHFSVFYTQEDLDRGKPEHVLQTAKTEGRYEDEGWRIRKDGSPFWANVIVTAIRRTDGELIGFSKITRDFSSRKTAQESLLVELSNAVLAGLDIRKMLTAIAAGIQHIVPHDYAIIALYDEQSGRLLAQDLQPHADSAFAADTVISIDGTPSGWVFTNQQPLFFKGLARDRFIAASFYPYIQAGVKSGCWLPLRRRSGVIGTIFIGSRSESGFDRVDVEMLLQIAGQIGVAIDNAQAFRQITELTHKLSEEKRYLEEELRTEYGFEEIVGESPGLKRVLKQVETVAPTDATTLILGETGTGKELIARAIHQLSRRRDRTFVKLNCSAIPMGLLESELFGHEKGAFTGAISQKVGRLELAHRGTLFLDEIGDLPLELQPKILRALQEKEIERLGGRRTIPVDVRLIAATNRDLNQMMREGRFRSDLYYRLNVFPISVPPLRQRRADIPLLVNYFVTKHARRMNKSITTVPPEVMESFTKWHWPGNVRELENFIERAVILTQGNALRAPLAELEIAVEPSETTDVSLHATEREHILRVLRETGGMIGGHKGAAERLGLKRTTLNSKLKKLGISREDYA